MTSPVRKKIGEFSKGILLTCLMVDFFFKDYDSIDVPMHHIVILMRYLNKKRSIQDAIDVNSPQFSQFLERKRKC